MTKYGPIELRAYYRASSHLPLWEVLEQSGLWRAVGVEHVHWEYCDSSTPAENALAEGRIDFISGNHITPYKLFAEGFPIVHLASSRNSVRDKLATRRPVESLTELRGWRLGETAQTGPDGGYAHNRGNHILFLKRAGVERHEVEWVELARSMSDGLREKQFRALQDGRIDAAFVTGSTAAYEAAGYPVLELDPLPMIHGPTLTTTTKRLARPDRLGERLLKAMVLAIHFATTHEPETNRLLESLAQRLGETRTYTAARIARLPRKPYPTLPAVANAYELACLQYAAAREISPLALWDLHYLRALDESGYIDGLYVGD
ncbi:MAG TPA: hypothetical protein VII06_39105 [Chloroflexota bacterium]|jgi:ABC-type nitrate/sulfonate/bicarbonate transport system substrate-binding protein